MITMNAPQSRAKKQASCVAPNLQPPKRSRRFYQHKSSLPWFLGLCVSYGALEDSINCFCSLDSSAMVAAWKFLTCCLPPQCHAKSSILRRQVSSSSNLDSREKVSVAAVSFYSDAEFDNDILHQQEDPICSSDLI